MADALTGGCMCGRVRYVAAIASHDAYLCHCRMCQRATGSISIAFVQVDAADVRWLTPPDWYDSSSIARRPFCATCGTSLGFVYKDAARGAMDLTVASFDDPSRFRPVMHAGSESVLEAWMTTSVLPRQPTNAEAEAATAADARRHCDAA